MLFTDVLSSKVPLRRYQSTMRVVAQVRFCSASVGELKLCSASRKGYAQSQPCLPGYSRRANVLKFCQNSLSFILFIMFFTLFSDANLVQRNELLSKMLPVLYNFLTFSLLSFCRRLPQDLKKDLTKKMLSLYCVNNCKWNHINRHIHF